MLNFTYQTSFQKIAHFLIAITILTFILIVGKDILVPLTFGTFLSFILSPIYRFWARYINSRILGATLTIISALLPLFFLFAFFCYELQLVMIESPDIIAGIEEGIRELASEVGTWFNFSPRETDRYLTQGLQDMANEPYDLLSSSLWATGNFIFSFLLVVIYTFIFLLYRIPFRRFFLQQIGSVNAERSATILDEIHSVAKFYFGGMLKVMLILGILNTLGLWLIGLDYPALWGFLAALLAVIPYVGTFLGGLFPFLYAFSSGDGYWQSLAVVALYTLVQSLEGNFITPKIVGKSVNLNPLAAIIAILIGEAIWGLPGMILALPFLAMIRIIMNCLPRWQPVALAISDEFFDHSERYEQDYNHEEYRLGTLFRRKGLENIAPQSENEKPSTKPNQLEE